MKQEIQKNERGFFFFELRSGAHNYIRTRIWVHRDLVNEEETLDFPLVGAKVVKTPKGGLVLRPAENEHWVALITERSGYRGTASISVEAVEGGEVEVITSGREFHSPRGSLGETAWALINVRGKIRVRAHITGRRISKNDFSYTLSPTGEKVEEICEEVEKFLTQ